MANKIYPMTESGYASVVKELEGLKKNQRPEVIHAIAEARSHGDLSENAEYKAAKEKQKTVEARIADLEIRIANAQVIDIQKLDHSTVLFGACVTLKDLAAQPARHLVYYIVGENEANVVQGKLSVNAPLAKGLLSKKVGDKVEIQTPGGSKQYLIEKISYHS